MNAIGMNECNEKTCDDLQTGDGTTERMYEQMAKIAQASTVIDQALALIDASTRCKAAMEFKAMSVALSQVGTSRSIDCSHDPGT